LNGREEKKMLNQTKTNQKENELSENQFIEETTGLIFEKVTINLPSSIVNYYRIMAHFQKATEQDMISNSIVDNLNAELNSRSSEDWKQTLNLTSTLKKLII
jgi:hypothetical protein